jgi:hypothetical protein
MSSLYSTTTMVTGKSYIVTLYYIICIVYLVIQYFILLIILTRQIYTYTSFVKAQFLCWAKLKKKTWRPHKIFLFHDMWWRPTNRRLQFVWSRGLLVNTSEILGMLACIYIHRCWQHQKSFWQITEPVQSLWYCPKVCRKCTSGS